MKDEGQYYHFDAVIIEGDSEGEAFHISPRVDANAFILTVVEPEDYGETRQVASAYFSRQQMITIVARLTEALYPVSLED